MIIIIMIMIIQKSTEPRVHQLRLRPLRGSALGAAARRTRKGGGYGWKPPSSSNFSVRALLELMILLKLDKQLSIEQFKPTVSQSTVPSPPLDGCEFLWMLPQYHDKIPLRKCQPRTPSFAGLSRIFAGDERPHAIHMRALRLELPAGKSKAPCCKSRYMPEGTKRATRATSRRHHTCHFRACGRTCVRARFRETL